MPSSTPPETKNLLDSFYKSLDPKDKIIHELAAKMLKTRYDPRRSNAFIQHIAATQKATA
jgi:hypothetical protein